MKSSMFDLRVIMTFLIFNFQQLTFFLPHVLQLGFMMLCVFWKFDFPPFMVLVIAVLNDGKSTHF